MKSKNIVVLSITLILVSCSSVPTQVPTIPVLATSTLLSPEPIITKPIFTETLSPTETSTSINPAFTERLCTPEDFSSPSTFTNLNNLETLIGFRPDRDWLPSKDWKKSIGIYNSESHYLVAGFRDSNQHLVILKTPICRYGENGKYALSEIVDFIWLPSLEEDDIIIWGSPTESCCFLQPTIIDRLEFRFEWFALSECTKSLPTAIMIAKYDIAGLPQKITVGYGYDLPVKLTKGWLPNINIGKFEEFPTEDISCTISLVGG